MNHRSPLLTVAVVTRASRHSSSPGVTGGWHRGISVSDPLGFHITLRLEGSRNLTPTVEARRIFARTVLTIAQPYDLLACRWVDTHGHLETMGSREAAGELARRVEIGLQQKLEPGAPFQAAYFEPMMTMTHVKNTFEYILAQLLRHGVEAIDRHHEGSNGPDLIGARDIGSRTAHVVKQYLTRITRSDILAALALPDPESVTPIPVGLLEAGAAAIGVADMRGRTAEVVAARVALAHVAGELPAGVLASTLHVSVRNVHRMRAETPSPTLVRAIRQQLAMRQRLIAR
jgi:hypothetical protein